MRVISEEQVLSELRKKSKYARGNYLAMYSSWFGGIVEEPSLMFLPIDDHIVHRGDGVFEAFRTQAGRILEFEAHLARLKRSASAIGISLPNDSSEIFSICLELMALAPKDSDVLFRLYVSRGPGGFTTNPYECVGSQLYIVMTRFQPYPEVKYQLGVKAGVSQVLAKSAPYCQIKTCNYLPNVMMKKEAVDRELDYTLCFTEQGELAEGSTENVLLFTSGGEVLAPLFDYTLKGTTLLRVLNLVRTQVGANSLVKSVNVARLYRSDIDQASEIIVVGTTMGVLPVTEWEKKPVGSGKVGPFFKMVHALLKEYYLNPSESESFFS